VKYTTQLMSASVYVARNLANWARVCHILCTYTSRVGHESVNHGYELALVHKLLVLLLHCWLVNEYSYVITSSKPDMLLVGLHYVPKSGGSCFEYPSSSLL